jgi:hypothetical protein
MRESTDHLDLVRRFTFMKAKEFDQKFDRGESVLKHLDLSKAIRPASSYLKLKRTTISK